MAKPPKTAASASKSRVPRKKAPVKPAPRATKPRTVVAPKASPVVAVLPPAKPVVPAAVPRPLPPPAPIRPKKARYGGVAGVAATIAVLAVALFLVVKWSNPPPAPVASTAVTSSLPPEVLNDPTFLGWVSGWKTIEPYLSRSEFAAARTTAFTTAALPTPSVDDIRVPRSNRYVWSDDQTRFVDYLAKYPDDPSYVAVYGRQGVNLDAIEGACDAGCVIEGAFWSGDSKFGLLVRTPALKADGSPLCITAGDGSASRCYEKLAVEWFDLATGKRTEYLSAGHVFATHPTDAARRSRWASGLTPEEQVNAGAVPAGDVAYSQGGIAVMSPEGTTFTIDEGQFGKRAVKIVAGTRVRDAKGEPVQFTYLRQGFTIKVTGLQAGQSLLVADKIDVLATPRILFSAPEADSAVGSTFGILGSGAVDAWPIDATVTGAGKTLFHKSMKKPVGDAAATYLDFVLEVTLPRTGLTAGDKLHLSLKPKTGDGAIEYDVTYRP